MNYRNEACGFLKRAEEELNTKDDQRLKYAALELRMAMEAITYDRARAYKDKFPPSEYETWQPRKVMSVLLKIDPMADQDCTIRYSKEDEGGTSTPEMKSLGSEKVLNMATLKKHYNALGSYLHMPTIKQIHNSKPQNFDKLRTTCEKIAAIIQQVLSSRVYNVKVSNSAKLDCMECGKPIRKRIPHGKSEVYAECNNDTDNNKKCPASYTIYRILEKGKRKVKWQPDEQEIECGNKDCKDKFFVWHRDVGIGEYWICQKCEGRNVFALGIRFEPKGT